MNSRRVVITGMGCVTSIGIGIEDFWTNLIAGKSGISDVTLFDTSKYGAHRAGEIKGFRAEKYIESEKLTNIARASQFALAATKMALKDASLDKKEIPSKRTGVIMGTTMADIQSLEQINKYWVRDGEGAVWMLNVIKYPSNSLSYSIAHYYGINGPNCTIPTACSAGNYSIGYSYDIIRKGRADIMIAGGADPFSRITFTGFNKLLAVAPEKCQPFDRGRKGMMVGEGAGVLILESLESALKRKSAIYAEVLGYALSCDAHHMTSPSVAGIARVMRKAIENAGIDIRDVDYISAHGTGTPANDKAECAAIKEVFGSRHRDIPVSSIKSMLGHTMGAASAIEAIACCLSIRDNVVPPTINYETADIDCDIDCVPNRAVKKNVKIALNNSLAFGGNNACVVLGCYE